MPHHLRPLACAGARPAFKAMRDTSHEMNSSPALHSILNLLVCKVRTVSPVSALKFSLMAVRALLWKAREAGRAASGVRGVFMASQFLGAALPIPYV